MAEADSLHAIDDWLAALLRQASPQQVRLVNSRVARDLRRRQADRIRAQQNPDGSAYTPRKPRPKNLRGKKGSVRRKAMFARLRTARHLKSEGQVDYLAVGFRGRAAMIAAVHQYGQQQRGFVRDYTMPKRELLGLTESDRQLLADAYLKHLAEFGL